MTALKEVQLIILPQACIARNCSEKVTHSRVQDPFMLHTRTDMADAFLAIPKVVDIIVPTWNL